MKTFLVFFILFGSNTILRSQDELIVLQSEPIEFEANGYYIEKVTDGRSNKDSIGFVQKGLFKKKTTRALFKKGLEASIYNYLKESFTQDPTSLPVVLRITHLHISESKGLPVKGTAEIKMEFLREKDGSLGRLYEAEAFVEKPAVDVTKTHEERIREVIVTCLESFNKSDWQSISPMYFK